MEAVHGRRIRRLQPEAGRNAARAHHPRHSGERHPYPQDAHPGVNDEFTIITGIAGWTGDWGAVSVVNPPAAWASAGKSFRIDQGSVMLTVIPEPGTFGVMLSVLAAAIIRRRRIG